MGKKLVGIVTISEIKADLLELSGELLQLKLKGKLVWLLHIVNDEAADVIKDEK